MGGRQNLKSDKPLVDVNQEGIFFIQWVFINWVKLLCLLVCQKCNLVSPEFKQEDIGFKGITGTSSAICYLKYKDGGVISYTATRGGHGNPFGFASRWSGNWLFHGTKGDIKRDGGRLTLFRNGNIVKDFLFKRS